MFSPQRPVWIKNRTSAAADPQMLLKSLSQPQPQSRAWPQRCDVVLCPCGFCFVVNFWFQTTFSYQVSINQDFQSLKYQEIL